MKTLTIELDPSELRILRRKAARQVRTPENLARYLIVKGLGLVLNDEDPFGNTEDWLDEPVELKGPGQRSWVTHNPALIAELEASGWRRVQAEDKSE